MYFSHVFSLGLYVECVCVVKYHAACRIGRCVSPGHSWPGDTHRLIFKDASAQCNETNPIWNVGCRKLCLQYVSWVFMVFLLSFFFPSESTAWKCFECVSVKNKNSLSQKMSFAEFMRQEIAFVFWQKETLFFPSPDILEILRQQTFNLNISMYFKWLIKKTRSVFLSKYKLWKS